MLTGIAIDAGYKHKKHLLADLDGEELHQLVEYYRRNMTLSDRIAMNLAQISIFHAAQVAKKGDKLKLKDYMHPIWPHEHDQ